MRELLSNDSLFVGQLCEYKSLTLPACDLIFFTTDLQTVNYYSSNSLLELIYFLNKLKLNQRSHYNLLNAAFKILNSRIILKTFTHERFNEKTQCVSYMYQNCDFSTIKYYFQHRLIAGTTYVPNTRIFTVINYCGNEMQIQLAK